ncbi:hypothetical protein [Deinococcus humi]|uniref:Uncharacterized protein n=1 Tax=Deinococcus humi TaxID=662880 RepID=A0A7W8NHC8_9DEIO|nr:hypothetical protein [Deinococcus humi]MBB5365745.1 hypothetical protein [Deinococcus humi]
MRRKIAKYRRELESMLGNPPITCLMLAEPFFLPQEEWIPIPASFKSNIVVGTGYRTEQEEGRWLFDAVTERLQARLQSSAEERPATVAAMETPRYGAPQIVRPRLGQSTFRALVTEAYGRRCAVTGKRPFQSWRPRTFSRMPAAAPTRSATGCCRSPQKCRGVGLGEVGEPLLPAPSTGQSVQHCVRVTR